MAVAISRVNPLKDPDSSYTGVPAFQRSSLVLLMLEQYLLIGGLSR